MTGRSIGPIRLRVSLIYPEIAVVTICLFYAMIHRGADYATPPDEEVTSLTVVEQALSFTTWGWIYIVIGVVGILGLFWVRWPLTAIAHGVAVAVWAAFGVGSILSIVQRVQGSPSGLAVAWVATLSAASLVCLAVTYWRAPAWRAAAWILVIAVGTGGFVALASGSGLYGWRTATDWIFVQAVAHAMMADASFDAWREIHFPHEEDAHAVASP